MDGRNCVKVSRKQEREQPGMDATGLTREDKMKLFPPVFRKRPASSKKDVPWVWTGGPSKPVREDSPWAEADRIRRANRRADPWFELTRDKEGMELVKNVQRTQDKVLSVREKRLQKLVEFAVLKMKSPEDEAGRTEVKNDGAEIQAEARVKKDTVEQKEKVWAAINKTTVSTAALKRSGAPALRTATSRRVSAEAPLSVPEQTPVFKINLRKELEDFDEAEQKAEKMKYKEDQGRKTGRRRKC